MRKYRPYKPVPGESRRNARKRIKRAIRDERERRAAGDTGPSLIPHELYRELEAQCPAPFDDLEVVYRSDAARRGKTTWGPIGSSLRTEPVTCDSAIDKVAQRRAEGRPPLRGGSPAGDIQPMEFYASFPRSREAAERRKDKEDARYGSQTPPKRVNNIERAKLLKNRNVR
jgi:hypothetical protein